MNGPWAMRIDSMHAAAAGFLRRTEGIEALAAPEVLWLRGEHLTDALAKLLQCVPGERFARNKAGKLVPQNCVLPVLAEPAGKWQPIDQVLRIAIPRSLFPGHDAPRVALKMVPSTAEAPANLLVTERGRWFAWMESAPQIRFIGLQFALSEFHALIRGTPLPNLPGDRFVELGGVAIPSGHAIIPALDPAVLSKALGLSPGDLALLQLDGTSEVLPREVFVPATRSAIRLSAQVRACHEY